MTPHLEAITIDSSITILIVIITTLIFIIITLITVITARYQQRTIFEKYNHKLAQQSITHKMTNIIPSTVAFRELEFKKEDRVRRERKGRRELIQKYVLALLVFGIISLLSSIVFISYILALVGLGLIFWGTLFLYIRPVTYIKSNLVDSSILPLLTILDGILTQLNYKGDAVYLPPKSLEGTRVGTLFIGAKKESVIPPLKGVPQGKVFINPHGIWLIPSGQDLVNLFQKELGTDLFKTDLYYLQNNLSRLVTQDLELAEDFNMDIKGDIVHVKIKGSIFSDICNEARKLANICSHIGCPLCSAIAYSLAKASGKAVMIEKNEFNEDTTIETWYRLFEIN